MAKVSLLPRGFKSKAEKTAVALRVELGLSSTDAMCGFKLAEHLKVKVFTPPEIFPAGTNLDELVGSKNTDKGWSALTMKVINDDTIIVHNHLHAPPRQQSNLMHELAHIICDHKRDIKDYNPLLNSLMRDHNTQQEAEANYLGSALQITRDALIWAIKKRMTLEEISNYYNASLVMVKLRVNSTGVNRQLSYLGPIQ